MKYFFFLFFIFGTIYSQYYREYGVKQITSFEFDCRNPAFFDISNEYFSNNSGILLETHSDTAANIWIMNYDIESDSFYLPRAVTSNSFLNINPKGKLISKYGYEQLIIWETNLNGNWNIAYSLHFNDGYTDTLSLPKFLTTTLSDEKNPSFVLCKNQAHGWPYEKIFEILYEKEHSIFFLQT